MKPSSDPTGGKKPVNLNLSDVNVAQARRFTTNLSATVDGLLAEYVAREGSAREAKQPLRDDVCAALNRLGEIHGSFADEHSTL
jgi:post-segregation antitoxin (ccd killing protein)